MSPDKPPKSGKLKRVIIRSDGHGKNTRVSIDGEECNNLQKLTYDFRVDNFNKIELTLLPMSVDIDAMVEPEKITVVEPVEKKMYELEIPPTKPGMTMLTTFIQHAKSKNTGIISVFFEDHLAKHPGFNKIQENYLQNAIEAIQSEKMSKPTNENCYARTFKVIENPGKPNSLTFHTSGEDDPGFIDFHIPEELL